MDRLIVILNGISRKKRILYQNILPVLAQHYQVDVWETKHQEHALELGHKAAQQNPFGVLAAGGDGTLNQVLNGIFKSNSTILPALGIIPLGTGNDFARLVNIKQTAESVLQKIQAGGLSTDVGHLVCVDETGKSVTRYFINVASLGMGPAVVKELFNSSRKLGPSLTYLQAILKVFFTHKAEAIEVKTENWQWRGNARVVGVANGQSFGGGIFIAPDAQPDDGVFSTFIAGNLPLLKFLFVLQKVKMKKIDSHIQYGIANTLTLTSTNSCWVETEGELAGLLPATIELLPKAIRFFR